VAGSSWGGKGAPEEWRVTNILEDAQRLWTHPRRPPRRPCRSPCSTPAECKAEACAVSCSERPCVQPQVVRMIMH